jgi:hypothetical protein
MRLKKPFLAVALAMVDAISLPAQDQVSLTVDATMDIYRAGGYNDGSNGIAPVVFSFPAGAWRTMTFPSVGGAWSCASSPLYGADGALAPSPCYNVSNIPNPVGPFSGFLGTDFGGALVGVFLGDTSPAVAPPTLHFYFSNSSQGGVQTNFLTQTPKIGQVFFLGDGLTGTGTGTIQKFFVPPTATHLYLGYIDSCTQTTPGVPGCYTGNAGSLSVTARLQQYVPDWVEPTLSSAPSGRCCSGIAYDAAHNYTLLFGGGDSGQPNPNPQNDTWVWRGGWYKLSPATSPSARAGLSMTYDPTTGTVVLFGGLDADGNNLNDTWTWDGVTWTQQFPPVSPQARSGYMTYDAATEIVVLFGGGGQSSNLADTWEWNGLARTWTQKFPAASPSPREAPLAYDPITGEIVLFGGSGSAGDLDDTWTWNGVTWTQQFPAASPSPRRAASTAYDVSLGQVVVFGGRDDATGQVFNDTWGWNGSTWTELKVPAQPSGRYAATMDFDPISNGLPLFAGWLECCTPLDDTWLLIPVAVR